MKKKNHNEHWNLRVLDFSITSLICLALDDQEPYNETEKKWFYATH